MPSPYTATAVTTAILGAAIPAHDETLDLAEAIGQKLDAFRAYVASVRSEEQADEAVKELLTALLAEGNVEPTNTTKA
jgi:hypothetical protein